VAGDVVSLSIAGFVDFVRWFEYLGSEHNR
jgi:hypothetical protein